MKFILDEKFTLIEASTDWQKLLTSLAQTPNAVEAINRTWDAYFTETWRAKAAKLQAIREPIQKELMTYGFDATQNPFIPFLNYLLAKQMPLTLPVYGTIHNLYGTDSLAVIKKEDLLGDKNNLIFNPQFWTLTDPREVERLLRLQAEAQECLGKTFIDDPSKKVTSVTLATNFFDNTSGKLVSSAKAKQAIDNLKARVGLTTSEDTTFKAVQLPEVAKKNPRSYAAWMLIRFPTELENLAVGQAQGLQEIQVSKKEAAEFENSIKTLGELDATTAQKLFVQVLNNLE